MRAHRAAVVARPNAEQLEGMFEAMAELEALCAGYAAERMTTPERRALEDFHEKLRVLIQSGDPQAITKSTKRFTTASIAARTTAISPNSTLATRARVQPFRRAQFRILGRLAKSHVEHDRVVEAILRGERAVAASPCMRTSSRCARNTTLQRDDFSGRLSACQRRLLRARETRASRRSWKYRARRDGRGLDQEAFHARAVDERDGADRERRWHRVDEAAEGFDRQRPDFDLDRRALAVLDAQQPGFGGVPPLSA